MIKHVKNGLKLTKKNGEKNENGLFFMLAIVIDQ